MDALTALSLASSIITFVDFGSKLLSNTRKIYKSKDGALNSIVDAEVVTSDLLTLTQSLRSKLPENGSLVQQSSSGGEEDDEALEKICIRCVALAEELARRLNRLKLQPTGADGNINPAFTTPNSSVRRGELMLGGQATKAPKFRRWESFRKALEAIWSKREIEEMAATLHDLRDEMEFRILVTFRRSLHTLAVRQSDASVQLQQSTQRIIDAFLTSRESFAGQLREQSEKLIQIQQQLTQSQSDDSQNTEGVTSRHLYSTGSFESSCHQDLSRERSDKTLVMEEKLCILMTENEILGNFSFSSMMNRKETIEPAHIQTFRWIHEEPGSTGRAWHNFVAWLRHGQGIYWVNGKLGSGKSTLMKYIYEHRKTRDELKSWSGDLPVDISGFFFWSSGDEGQKSQSGLLRSLLHQLFQRHRDMLQHLLPDTWDAYYLRSRFMLSRREIPLDSPLLPPKPPDLTLRQLQQAFRDLVSSLQNKFRLCFFIDGLDEYGGDYLELTEFLLKHGDLPGVKFCISSRPLLVFEQAFGDLPGLRLEDLSKQDIKRYVISHLYSHKYMKQLERRHPDEASQLVADIRQKARGVFLWVKLVTRSLLRGLSDYNRISDLKKRVSYLPSDLEALYEDILNKVEPVYRKEMSKLFQIFRVAQNGSTSLVTLLNLSWADDEEDLMVETASIQPYTKAEIAERCEIMRVRLKSVCAGLLETTNPKFSSFAPDCHVLYLHRTVADWLAKPNVWMNLTSTTAGMSFSPNLAMLKSRIMRLKTWDPAYHGILHLSMVVDALNYARDAEQDLDCGFPKLLDQLDIATSFHWRNTKVIASHLQAESPLSDVSDSSSDSWYSLIDDANQISHMSPLPIPVVQRETQNSSRLKYLGEEGEGFDNIDIRRRHWSYAIELPGVEASGKPSTFYDLARVFGLTHYVNMKYDAGYVAEDQRVNHWLLMQAFSRTRESPRLNGPKDPNIETVKRILASGIDPNMSFDGGVTPWQGALLDAFWHLARRPIRPDDSEIQTQIWRRKAEAWARILEEFLQHGSDPDGPAVRLPGRPRVTPMVLVEAYSLNSLTEEAKRLEARIYSEMTRRRARAKYKLRNSVEAPDAPLSTAGQTDFAKSLSTGTEPRGIMQWLFAWASSGTSK